MRFRLIDRILELEPGQRIVAVKRLRPDEDYLQDHFPLFPVMPGVLMLEAMYQTSTWLVRASEDFRHAIVVLKEARGVKYADFVKPGQDLVVTAELLKQDAATTTLKTQGLVGDSVAVTARLVLERFDLADRYPGHGPDDPYARRYAQQVFAELTRGIGPAASIQ